MHVKRCLSLSKLRRVFLFSYWRHCNGDCSSWILELVMVPTSWIWQDELYLPSEWNQTDLGASWEHWRPRIALMTTPSCCSHRKKGGLCDGCAGWLNVLVQLRLLLCCVFCATDAWRSDDWRNYLARRLGRGKCCRVWVEVFLTRSSCPIFMQNMTSEIF